MCDGYHAAGDDDQSGLDEFLCEYVDGTMDPDVRAVFEECLRADPALAEHVDRLRETRLLLCRYGCQCNAPQGLQARLRRQLYCEMMRSQAPLFPTVVDRLRTAATYTCAAAVLAALVMVFGAALVAEDAPRIVSKSGAGSVEQPVFWRGYRQASAILLPHAALSPMHRPVSAIGGTARSALSGALTARPLPTFDSLRTVSRDRLSVPAP